MKRDGLENVHTEKVMVPNWVRGNESAEIVEPARHRWSCSAWEAASARRPDGVQAEVLIVHSFNELEAAGQQVKGRIVFFNVPYTAYEETVTYRSDGPSRAARLGAVATLVRSVGPARSAHAPYRQPAVHPGRAADSRRSNRHGGRRPAPAHRAIAAPASSCA